MRSEEEAAALLDTPLHVVIYMSLYPHYWPICGRAVVVVHVAAAGHATDLAGSTAGVVGHGRVLGEKKRCDWRITDGGVNDVGGKGEKCEDQIC